MWLILKKGNSPCNYLAMIPHCPNGGVFIPQRLRQRNTSYTHFQQAMIVMELASYFDQQWN
jgi:hypothetical protein